jgi:hypothetical protein
MVISIEAPLDEKTVTPIEVAIGDRVRVVHLWDFGVEYGSVGLLDLSSQHRLISLWNKRVRHR